MAPAPGERGVPGDRARDHYGVALGARPDQLAETSGEHEGLVLLHGVEQPDGGRAELQQPPCARRLVSAGRPDGGGWEYAK